MSIELKSPCKVNLLLNILGRREDGFHELETVLQPVALSDVLCFKRGGEGIQLNCSDSTLPADSSNLVYRAAIAFLKSQGISEGVQIRLEKKVPMAAGLGGGSSNAAATLLGLNSLFGDPASPATLYHLAATLGSDVPFFLQSGPAIGTGRGETIDPVKPFECLLGAAILLIRPGFGISTPWAYQALAGYPDALNGKRGLAAELVGLLRGNKLSREVASALFNSLEAPVFHKYPILALLKEYLLEQSAAAALMSGSGSTTFALVQSVGAAEVIREKVLEHFGSTYWTAIVPF